MHTYKKFLLKAKTVGFPQLLHTKLQDTSGKNPVLSESCGEIQGLAAGAELRSPAVEGQAPLQGKVVKPLSCVGDERHLHPGSRGRRARRHPPLGPHQRLGRRPPPLTAANLDSWPDLRSTPAVAPAPGSRSQGSGGLAGSLLPAARLPGAGRQPEKTRSRAKGGTLSGRGTPECRGAHSV